MKGNMIQWLKVVALRAWQSGFRSSACHSLAMCVSSGYDPISLCSVPHPKTVNDHQIPNSWDGLDELKHLKQGLEHGKCSINKSVLL